MFQACAEACTCDHMPHMLKPVFSSTILHGSSNEPEEYLEPSQTSTCGGAFLQK